MTLVIRLDQINAREYPAFNYTGFQGKRTPCRPMELGLVQECQLSHSCDTRLLATVEIANTVTSHVAIVQWLRSGVLSSSSVLSLLIPQSTSVAD